MSRASVQRGPRSLQTAGRNRATLGAERSNTFRLPCQSSDVYRTERSRALELKINAINEHKHYDYNTFENTFKHENKHQ